jgi:hypothetical protein
MSAKKGKKMEFYDYFVKHVKHIHRGLYPKRKDFYDFLRHDLTEDIQALIYSVYRNANIMGVVNTDYKLKYALYGSKSSEIKKTIERAKNRSYFEKLGLVKKGDGKEIHHKDGNAFNNDVSNLQVIDACTHAKKHGRACEKEKKKKKKK